MNIHFHFSFRLFSLSPLIYSFFVVMSLKMKMSPRVWQYFLFHSSYTLIIPSVSKFTSFSSLLYSYYPPFFFLRSILMRIRLSFPLSSFTHSTFLSQLFSFTVSFRRNYGTRDECNEKETSSEKKSIPTLH